MNELHELGQMLHANWKPFDTKNPPESIVLATGYKVSKWPYLVLCVCLLWYRLPDILNGGSFSVRVPIFGLSFSCAFPFNNIAPNQWLAYPITWFPFCVPLSFSHAFPVLITFHLINDQHTTVHSSLRFETEAVGVSGGGAGLKDWQGENFFCKFVMWQMNWSFFNKEKPDVWIEPSKSKIVQVKATEIINSDK